MAYTVQTAVLLFCSFMAMFQKLLQRKSSASEIPSSFLNGQASRNSTTENHMMYFMESKTESNFAEQKETPAIGFCNTGQN